VEEQSRPGGPRRKIQKGPRLADVAFEDLARVSQLRNYMTDSPT
jgi:hypothetical protein